MSDRRTYRLVSPSVRQAACRAITEAPEGYLCEIKEPTRNSEQNAKMWAMLSDVSKQVTWHDVSLKPVKLSPESWKHMFTAALDKEQAMMPNLSGDGFVVLGKATSSMSKRKFAELIEFVYAFGAERGVAWIESKEE